MIDYAAAEVDHPAVDVARTLGSLVGDDEDAWQHGLAAYRRTAEFSEHDEGFARVLDRTGVVLSVASWLIRLYHEQETVMDRGAVAARLGQLVGRMERWTAAGELRTN